MEFNENQDTMPITDNQPDPEPENSGVYSGAGVGQKESPYANSPYYSYYQPQPPHPEPEPQPEPDADAEPRPKSRPFRETLEEELSDEEFDDEYWDQVMTATARRERWRKVLAAVLAIVLAAGSCGLTAWIMNEQWEDRTEALQESFESQIAQLQATQAALQSQLSKVSSTGTGNTIQIPVVTVDGLTPSQVYAANVNSVVVITNEMVVSGSRWNSQSYTAIGTGSGFILSEDGYVVTNYHVVEGYSRLTVTTNLGDEYEATFVGGDEINDVALLKIDATGLDPVTVGSSDEMNVGDMVVAIGNPLGELTATQTVGYVSGKDRSVSTDGTIINMLQTDAAINSGSSGGPLFNMKGEVIGITTAKYSGSSSSGATIEGIGFAIPMDDVMSMLDDIKQYGYLKNQAYLGVEVLNMDSSTASMYSLPTGSYVQKVVEGGSAHRAGVQVKDIIIAIGEYSVEDNSSLTAALRKFSAGDTTTITVYRGGQEITMDITFDEKPGDLDTESTEPSVSGEMPENGSYEDWYDYFFGGRD